MSIFLLFIMLALVSPYAQTTGNIIKDSISIIPSDNTSQKNNPDKKEQQLNINPEELNNIIQEYQQTLYDITSNYQTINQEINKLSRIKDKIDQKTKESNQLNRKLEDLKKEIEKKAIEDKYQEIQRFEISVKDLWIVSMQYKNPFD